MDSRKKIVFLKGDIISLGYKRLVRVFSYLKNEFFSLSDTDAYYAVFSSEWFSSPDMREYQVHLFACFLKDLQDSGVYSVGFLASGSEPSRWFELFSNMGLVHFVTPKSVTFPVLGDNSGEVSELSQDRNVYTVAGFVFVDLNAESFSDSIIPKDRSGGSFYIFYGSSIFQESANASCLVLPDGSSVRSLSLLRLDSTPADVDYSCVSLLMDSFDATFTVSTENIGQGESSVINNGFSWADRVEEEKISRFSDISEFGLFWRLGLPKSIIPQVRRRISSAWDAEDFFEFLKENMK